MPNAVRDAFFSSAVGGALGAVVTKFGAIALGKVATQSATGSIVPVIGIAVAVVLSFVGITVTVMDRLSLVNLLARRDALEKKLSNPFLKFTERELCQLDLEKTKIDSEITAKVTGVAFNLADIGISPRAAIKGLVLDPRLNSTNLQTANTAQTEIETLVYSILKSFSIPTDVTKAMPAVTTTQATKMIQVLKRLDAELPAQAQQIYDFESNTTNKPNVGRAVLNGQDRTQLAQHKICKHRSKEP